MSDVFLGVHRLRDLPAPELLYQLVVDDLPARFPPLRSLEAPAYDLPSGHSTFVGRTHELQDVQSLLTRHRLVTLTGPGGVGKTRLALRVAAMVSESYPGGVVFVPLAAVRDATLVPDEIARALALPLAGYTGPQGMRRLADQLAGRQVLLVLDNLEQLLDGAAEIGVLLDTLGDVTALATSRAPLRLREEQEYPVTPLGVPGTTDLTLEQLLEHDAARQFVDRARAARPGFTVAPADVASIVCIVTAVDGLPLAVELAAARVRSLSVQQIADRLVSSLTLLSGGPRDLPERQRTLRTTLDWSYGLLPPSARFLLQSLAVFPGGVTLRGLDEIATTVVPREDLLDAVDALVDHSLMYRSVDCSERYRALQVVREFAAEKLRASPDAEQLRRRQAEWFTALVEETAPLLVTDRQREGLEKLRDEHDNLREALDWTTEHDLLMGSRLASSLWRYWQMRGHLAEGREVLARLLTALPPATESRARALSAAGGLAYWQHDRPATHALYAEAVAVYEQLGEKHRLADALYDLAFPLVQTDRQDEALELAQRSAALYAELADDDGVARTLWLQGLVALHRRETDRAEDLFTRAMRQFRETGDVFYLGWALRMLGLTRLWQGRPGDAPEPLRESLRLFAPAGDTSAIVLLLIDFATLAVLEDDLPRALRLTGAMRALRTASGTDLADYEINHVPALAQALAAAGPALQPLIDEGAAMDADAAVRYALSDSHLA